MPFGFRRIRRYNVSSKNTYLVRVFLLDNSEIECTISFDSLGKECMKNISQRLELAQPTYFGLRYLTKKEKWRWLDLDKILKKQIEKRAFHTSTPQLYVGLAFYIDGAHLIQDDVTRYHYYLQLKNDIIESKLPCSPEKAILLASYSVQAEFGDHSDRVTAEHLKEYILLPNILTTNEQTLLSLTQDIVSSHESLVGLPPSVAELQYIREAEKLYGYGTDTYTAKNSSGVDVALITSTIGISIQMIKDEASISCFRWIHITSISSSRRTLYISSVNNKKNSSYILEDQDYCKYLCKIFLQQMYFYQAFSSNEDTYSDVNSTQVSRPVSVYHDSSFQADIQHTASTSQTESMNYSLQKSHSFSIAKNGDPPNLSTQSSIEYPQQNQNEDQQFVFATPTPVPAPTAGTTAGLGLGPGMGPSSSSNANIGLQSTPQHPAASLEPSLGHDPSLGHAPSLSGGGGDDNLPAYRKAPDYSTLIRQPFAQAPANSPAPAQTAIPPHQAQPQSTQAPPPSSQAPPTSSVVVSNPPPPQQQHQQQVVYTDNGYPSQLHDTQEIMYYENTASLQHNQFMALSQPDVRVLANGHLNPGHNMAARSPSFTQPRSQVLMQTSQPAPIHQQQQLNDYNKRHSKRVDRANSMILYPSNPLDYRPPIPVRLGCSNVDLRYLPNGATTTTSSTSAAVAANITNLNNALYNNNHQHHQQQQQQQQQILHNNHLQQTPSHLQQQQQQQQQQNPTPVYSNQFHNLNSEQMFARNSAVFTPPPLAPAVPRQQIFSRSSTDVSQLIGHDAILPTVTNDYRKPPPPYNSRSTPDLPALIEPNVQQSLSLFKKQSHDHSMDNLNLAINNSRNREEGVESLLAQRQKQELIDQRNHIAGDRKTQSAMLHHSLHDLRQTNLRPDELARLTSDLYDVSPRPTPTVKAIAASSPPSSPPRSPITLTHSLADSLTPASSTPAPMSSTQSPQRRGSSRSAAGRTSPAHQAMPPAQQATPPGSDPAAAHDADTLRDRRQVDIPPLNLSISSDDDSQSPIHLHIKTMNGLNSGLYQNDTANDNEMSEFDDENVYPEFESIVRRHPPDKKYNCDVASNNKTRNRFQDVLPYNFNRVTIPKNVDNPDGYINASYIKLEIDKNKEPLLYIAGQAPMERTLHDFWTMVWTERIPIIVMLTPLMEGAREKCFKYWSDDEGQDLIVSNFTIKICNKTNGASYITRGLEVHNSLTNDKMVVWHLQYTNWPDRGCPKDPKHFLDFLDKLGCLRRILGEQEMSKSAASCPSGGHRRPLPTTLVHCSAGVGRTGVVLLVEAALARLERQTAGVSTPTTRPLVRDLLENLRAQRMYAVQTVGQYRFCLNSVATMTQSSRLI